MCVLNLAQDWESMLGQSISLQHGSFLKIEVNLAIFGTDAQ